MYRLILIVLLLLTFNAFGQKNILKNRWLLVKTINFPNNSFFKDPDIKYYIENEESYTYNVICDIKWPISKLTVKKNLIYADSEVIYKILRSSKDSLIVQFGKKELHYSKSIKEPIYVNYNNKAKLLGVSDDIYKKRFIEKLYESHTEFNVISIIDKKCIVSGSDQMTLILEGSSGTSKILKENNTTIRNKTATEVYSNMIKLEVFNEYTSYLNIKNNKEKMKRFLQLLFSSKKNSLFKYELINSDEEFKKAFFNKEYYMELYITDYKSIKLDYSLKNVKYVWGPDFGFFKIEFIFDGSFLENVIITQI